jgi:hypothetical protein
MRHKMTAGGLLQEITRHASENPFAESSMTIRSSDDEVQDFRDGERVELGRGVPEQGLAPSNGGYTVACQPSDNIFDTAIGRRRIMFLVDLRDDGFLTQAQQRQGIENRAACFTRVPSKQ